MDEVLTLRPMSEEEFAAWRPRLVREYAEEVAEAGHFSAEDALARSEAEIDEFLPAGLAQPDHLLLTATDADGQAVGLAWVALVAPSGSPDTAWISDIQVFPEHRGRGLGRALLAAVEAQVAERGVGHLALNVFGSNTAARRLYETSGYVVTRQFMSKELRPPSR